MKNQFKKILYKLNYKWLMRDVFLMESNPDFCDNSHAVFNEMIQRNLNNKYKFIWFVDDAKKFKDVKIKNVKFISRPGNFFDKLKYNYYVVFAKYIIDCNKMITKKNKNQFRLFLNHGTPIKPAVDYCNAIGEMDYLLEVSDFFKEFNSHAFHINKDKIVSLGLPRNDDLYYDFSNQFDLFSKIKRNKTVLWMPTYRNHKMGINKMDIFPYGVPCVHNEKEIYELNEYLKEKSILLLLKMHPCENEGKIAQLNLSNIKLIHDEYFAGHKNLYQMFSCVDAFITDYSSIYYDLLLTNKQIGLAIEDLEDYKNKNGLIYDNYQDNIKGEYIYNFTDLLTYFEHVSSDNDVCYVIRNEAKIKFHKYFDNQNAKRVVDFILSKIEK